MSNEYDGSWLSVGGEYQDLIKGLCASDPRLRQRDPKARWQGIQWPRDDSRLLVLELEPGGSFGSPMEQTPLSLRQYLEGQSVSADPNGRTVYVLEGQSPEYIAVIGSHFKLHPSFFSENDRTVVFSYDPRGESDGMVLPSMAMTREHITLPFFELFVLPENIRNTYKLYCNKTGRHIGATRMWRGFSEVGILRRKCSFWRRQRENGKGWDCIILTDPPLQEVRMNKSTTVPVSVHPFQSGYLDFIPHDRQLATRAGPPRHSMLGDVCFYLQHHSSILDLDSLDCTSVFLARIIASHYLKQADYLRALASDIAWRLTRKDEVVFGTRAVEAQWSDVQSLERRMSEYCEALEAVLIQLRIPFEDPNTATAQRWTDVTTDFQFLYMQFRSIRQRVVALNSAMTGLAGMAGNRQSVKEAKSSKALTFLGLIFIPLAYTASLFSMAEPYGPGYEKFWLYFAISFPLIALLVGIFYMVDTGADWHDWPWPAANTNSHFTKAAKTGGAVV